MYSATHVVKAAPSRFARSLLSRSSFTDNLGSARQIQVRALNSWTSSSCPAWLSLLKDTDSAVGQDITTDFSPGSLGLPSSWEFVLIFNFWQRFRMSLTM